MLGVYNYTVILTYAGVLTAYAGIINVFNDNIKTALLCLMVAGLFDMFDGKVAGTKKNRTLFEKRFGIQIDSLSDLISYGVLPALIMYQVDHPNRLISCICGVYMLCALIRLSYFNVDEEERQNSTEEERHEYRGLPVTSVALILPTVFVVTNCIHRRPGIIGAAVLAACGISFITPFKLIKPNNTGKAVIIVIGITVLTLLIRINLG